MTNKWQAAWNWIRSSYLMKNAVNAAGLSLIQMYHDPVDNNLHNWHGIKGVLWQIGAAVLMREGTILGYRLMKWSNTNGGTMKIIAIALLFLGLGTVSTQSQTKPPAPPPDPLESGWNVMVNGGYSSVQNAGTNNGFFFSTGIRVAQHWVARGDVFVLSSPAVTITLVKPEYRFSALHMVKNSNSAVVKNAEFFFNLGVGDAHFTDPAKGTQSKVAYGAGGGFDVKLSDTVTVRPLDVSYIRSSLIGGGKVIGNHLQLAAGLGLRF